MSMGIDWTSHSLHSCDDSETCGSEKLAAIMRITIILALLLLLTFIFPCLWLSFLVYQSSKCIDNTLIERDRHRQKFKTLQQREYSEVIWLMILGSMGKSLSKVKTHGYPNPPRSENRNILEPRIISHIQRS